jgi:hypothetical protein
LENSFVLDLIKLDWKLVKGNVLDNSLRQSIPI